MKPHLRRLTKALDSDAVQEKISRTRSYARLAGLCGEVSALGLVCTSPRQHLDEHRAMNEDMIVVQRWANR